MKSKYKYYDSAYDFLSRRQYYGRMIFPKSNSLFSEILQSKKNALPTNLPIVFRGLCFGDSPEIISGKLGKPRFVMENQGISSLVFFYKEKINHHSVITQVRFLDEEFFCASYAFRYENNEERITIKKMLFEKYANLNGTTFEKNNSLADNLGNGIFIFDSVFLNILYLWGNEKVEQAVSGSVHSPHFLEGVKKKKVEEELFSKL